MAKVPSAVEE